MGRAILYHFEQCHAIRQHEFGWVVTTLQSISPAEVCQRSDPEGVMKKIEA